MALPPPADSSTALVTGASSGIGAAFARELAARGHGLTLTARREERLRDLADELGERHGVRTEVLPGDLGDAGARDELVRQLSERGLDVDVLVNSAGFGDGAEFVGADRERLLRMVRLNCEALVDLQARFLPPMVARGAGAVLNIASTAAFQPMPGTATYAATKAFVLSLGEAVHAELAGTGVVVTAVCPGPVRTEFAQQAGIAAAEERTPGIVWMSAEEVAAHALRATDRGKRVVVPGTLNRAGALAGLHAPRAAVLPLVRRVWRRST